MNSYDERNTITNTRLKDPLHGSNIIIKNMETQIWTFCNGDTNPDILKKRDTNQDIFLRGHQHKFVKRTHAQIFWGHMHIYIRTKGHFTNVRAVPV